MTEKGSKETFILASEDFVKDFKELVSLSRKSILYLASTMNTEYGFGIPAEITPQEIISEINVLPDQLQKIFNISQFIYKQVVEKDIDLDNLFLNLKDIVQKHRLPTITKKKTALKKLFFISPKYKEKQKKLPYIKGLNYNLYSIAITCEARAIYPLKESEKIEILGYHPLLTMMIETKNYKDEAKKMLFNMDEEGLDSLIEKLKKAKVQIQFLKKDLAGDGKLI